ncbi:MAG: DNA mismatch repair endonuclease MutL [Dysgonamonadaceae bacterium]|jgi:DNA mismatch repair protein MutL|nr:DNA mismatch repair endonuclease MutL [Dysgonamonadaceae bacterium]
MSDLIRLLPDSIANQIAAGEVIQRPASVVKELVENAVDAGADFIQVILKKSGGLLIQVVDNGKGMSETDARMAFERHATSKIASAQDLFSLRSLGFRGEALASIAAVAQVELKTRRKDDELGTVLQIAASKVEKQEPAALPEGSSFSVKNLFFNIPVRRKFLKSPETELKNIISEFERVALVYPDIAFSLHDDNSELISLPVSNLKQRIINLMGKKIAQSLLPIQIDTSFLKVSGFIGAPSSSRKRGALQYFFVNGRYMRHPYFHRAVMTAFEPFIPAGDQPNYFIYLDVEPSAIDVNIHPTKTEIKFENEQMLFQVIASAVKEAIATPDLEFDREGAIDIPVYTPEQSTQVKMPQVQMRSDYNPFKETRTYNRPPSDWEQLYKPAPAWPSDVFANVSKRQKSEQKDSTQDPPMQLLAFKGRYLVTVLKSGLTLIDQRRAHIRILFDDYTGRMSRKQGLTQKLLFPEMLTFTPAQAAVLPCILDDLTFIGFDLADLGGNTYSINGIPAGLENVEPVAALQEMVDKVIETGCEITDEITESLALTLAQKAAIAPGKILSEEEAQSLIAKLFSSASPNYTPDGKLVLSVFSEDELGRRFK